MQGAAFGFGLIVAFLSCSTLQASCKHLGDDEGRTKVQIRSSKGQYRPDNARVWHIPWQSPWPIFTDEEEPVASGTHRKPDYNTESAHDTNDDTKRSTQAAVDQAYYARLQFITGVIGLAVSGLSAYFTAMAAIKAGAAATSAADAVAEAKRSTKISEDALVHQKTVAETDQRPWIVVTAVPAGDITFNGGYMHVEVIMIIENVGKTPASHVNCWPYIYLGTKSGMSKELVDRIIKPIAGRSMPAGVVMPGQKKVIGIFSVGISNDDIKTNDIFVNSGVLIAKICCIAEYKRSIARDMAYKTWVCYYILIDEGGVARYINSSDGRIAKEHIRFNDMGVGGAT
jgi:hypothetical protein